MTTLLKVVAAIERYTALRDRASLSALNKAWCEAFHWDEKTGQIKRGRCWPKCDRTRVRT